MNPLTSYGTKAMDQIEYKSVILGLPRGPGFFSQKPDLDGVESIDAELNKLGQEGWQLVAVFPFTDGSSPAQISKALHYFSRPKPTSKTDPQ
ncbi:MAG: DUF4177 domain-containing protein [Verrucomicrobiota bacterium JB023]|nr:DUF4177 domain-containing protein [Verrucomicrobiota bacterium JB023]